MASILGFIALFGIAKRNGIVLVSHIDHVMHSEGVIDFREAVLQRVPDRVASAQERFAGVSFLMARTTTE